MSVLSVVKIIYMGSDVFVGVTVAMSSGVALLRVHSSHSLVRRSYATLCMAKRVNAIPWVHFEGWVWVLGERNGMIAIS
jgi:hypothetical protein